MPPLVIEHSLNTDIKEPRSAMLSKKCTSRRRVKPPSIPDDGFFDHAYGDDSKTYIEINKSSMQDYNSSSMTDLEQISQMSSIHEHPRPSASNTDQFDE